MKTVIWTDERGYKHRALLRDGDPDHLAKQGIPDDPPDLDRLDWEAIRRDLYNLLVDRSLVTWLDVQESPNGLTNSIVSVLKRPVVGLYRQVEQEKKLGYELDGSDPF